MDENTYQIGDMVTITAQFDSGGTGLSGVTVTAIPESLYRSNAAYILAVDRDGFGNAQWLN